jgi:negative regulator of flagellin synthesis FlgM
MGTKPGEPDVAVTLNGINLSPPASNARKSSVAKAQSTATSSQDAQQQSQAEVSITSTAALLAKLEQPLSATPAFDAARVESVGKALAAGTYAVNPDKIAHGLIQTERALGQLKFSEV